MRGIKTVFIPWRFYLIITMLCLISTGLVWRVFDLAILDNAFLREKGNERVLRLLKTPAMRGVIEDRNGFPLAVSAVVYSAWVNPHEINLSPDDKKELAAILKLSPQAIQKFFFNLKKNQHEFVYFQRNLSPKTADQLKKLHIPGLYLQQGYKRFYPEGELTAQLVGFTNIDDVGQEGLELIYNDWLKGSVGKSWVIKNRFGEVINQVDKVTETKRGEPLKLSIDRRLQFFAYQALMDGVKKNQASSGSAVILDVKTGEVLAMVNVPSFNPNKRPFESLQSLRNRALTDTFEPGSTIKAFTVAAALQNQKYSLDTLVNTAPGWMRVDHNLVRDERNHGQLTLAEILQHSSNMGAAKIVLSLPANDLLDLLHRVGFGEISGIGFPGEQSGTILPYHQASPFALATLSFGYGLTVTSLQLARAYSILANHGIKQPVTLFKAEQSTKGEQVIERKVADAMLILLESVVAKSGGAKTAQIPGYKVAGKTGTAKIVGRGGYQKHRYISSFVGIAPVKDPHLVVAVVVHDPKGKQYYGGAVCGPIFKEIMAKALRLQNISPDAS